MGLYYIYLFFWLTLYFSSSSSSSLRRLKNKNNAPNPANNVPNNVPLFTPSCPVSGNSLWSFSWLLPLFVDAVSWLLCCTVPFEVTLFPDTWPCVGCSVGWPGSVTSPGFVGSAGWPGSVG